MLHQRFIQVMLVGVDQECAMMIAVGLTQFGGRSRNLFIEIERPMSLLLASVYLEDKTLQFCMIHKATTLENNFCTRCALVFVGRAIAI